MDQSELIQWAYGVKRVGCALWNVAMATRLERDSTGPEKVREELKELRDVDMTLDGEFKTEWLAYEAYEKTLGAIADRVLGVGQSHPEIRENNMATTKKNNGGTCAVCGREYDEYEAPHLCPANQACCPRCAKLVVNVRPADKEVKACGGSKVSRKLLNALREEYVVWNDKLSKSKTIDEHTAVTHSSKAPKVREFKGATKPVTVEPEVKAKGKKIPAAPKKKEKVQQKASATKACEKNGTKKKTKKPPRFEIMFNMLTSKNGVTKEALIEACAKADKEAGVRARAKVNSVYTLMYFLRKGKVSAYPGCWDIHQNDNKEGVTVFRATQHKGSGEGQTIKG